MRSLNDLLRLAKRVLLDYKDIPPTEDPATFFLALKEQTAAEAIALLHEKADTNVFHISRTRHPDLVRVELVSANDRPKLEEIVGGRGAVHNVDLFANRREKNLFIILDY